MNLAPVGSQYDPHVNLCLISHFSAKIFIVEFLKHVGKHVSEKNVNSSEKFHSLQK